MQIGDELVRHMRQAFLMLFRHAELVQLSQFANEVIVDTINNSDRENYEISYPIGYFKDTREPFFNNKKFTKEELKERYNFIRDNQLLINGVIQLVTIMEAVFEDVLRTILSYYPQKMGTEKALKYKDIFNSESIEELKALAVSEYIMDLKYSPTKILMKEYKKILHIDFNKDDNFKAFLELEATRDILIHNAGLVNNKYMNKAADKARGSLGARLLINDTYFLESYEICLRVCEILHSRFKKVWPPHSEDFFD